MSEDVQKPEVSCLEESRFSLLRDALKQATQKISSNILSQKAFMECLPQMKKKHPETLMQLHATFTEKMTARLTEDMDELLADLKLQEKLDFLDQLESEQAVLSQGETVWRPSGAPSKDLLAYDVPTLQSHRDELASYLKELQQQNEQEKKQLSEVAAEIRDAEKKIVEQLERNEKTFHTLSSIYSA